VLPPVGDHAPASVTNLLAYFAIAIVVPVLPLYMRGSLDATDISMGVVTASCAVTTFSAGRSAVDGATTYEGGCHGGRIRFRVTVDLAEATVCNCSVLHEEGDYPRGRSRKLHREPPGVDACCSRAAGSA
jgi:hypothetical protein